MAAGAWILAGALVPAPADAQGVQELLESLRRGGGWVAVPIEGGAGAVRTLPVPTLGLAVAGCARVWGGHSGTWHVQVEDLLGDGELDVETEPGEPVTFSYRTGFQTQLDVRVRWSEARDTTLLLWVGLEGGQEGRDACEPRVSGGA